MRPKIFSFPALVSVFLVFVTFAYAEEPAEQSGEGRYVLLIAGDQGVAPRTAPRFVPALVLDSWQGIVWRCRDLQDIKPVWIKADLGKNGDNPIGHKRYILKIADTIGSKYLFPAIVLDTEGGRVWTCYDVTIEEAKWETRDLPKEAVKEGQRY